MADMPTNLDTVNTATQVLSWIDQSNESELISVLQILIILIQHKYQNHESYSLYFGSNILFHYGIDKKWRKAWAELGQAQP